MELADQTPQWGTTKNDGTIETKQLPLVQSQGAVDHGGSESKPSDNSSCCSIYCAVKTFAGILLKCFFYSVEVVEAKNIPKEGATIFVGNHSGQFADAVTFLVMLPKQMSFLIAEKSLKVPVLGHLAQAIKCVSVTRAQDVAAEGVGKLIRVEPEAEMGHTTSDAPEDYIPPMKVLVTGKGTKFLTQGKLSLGSQIQYNAPSKTNTGETTTVMVRMTKVLSDEQLEGIVAEAKQMQESSQSFGERGASFKVLPKLDQQEMYKKVLDRLVVPNAALGIFPEGGSHDQTTLLPLKPGAVIMAMVAEARGIPVNIIPCGINYFQGHKFRQGRVVVQIGNPICASDDQKQRYMDTSLSEDQQSKVKREVVSELLKEVEVGLNSVWLHAPSYEDLQLALLVRKLWVPSGVMIPAEDFLELSRRFVTSIAKLKDAHEGIRNCLEDIREYIKDLKAVGLTDKNIREYQTTAKLSWFSTLWMIPTHMVVLVVLVPLSLPLVLLHLPAVCLVDYLAAAKIKRAVAESAVKLKGFDIAASTVCLVGLQVFPAFYILEALGFYLLMASWGIPYATLLSVLFFLAVFPVSFMSLLVFELALASWHSIRFTCSSCKRREAALSRLASERRRLQESSRDLVKLHFMEAAEVAGFSPERKLIPPKVAADLVGTAGPSQSVSKLQISNALRADQDLTDTFTTLATPRRRSHGASSQAEWMDKKEQ